MAKIICGVCHSVLLCQTENQALEAGWTGMLTVDSERMAGPLLSQEPQWYCPDCAEELKKWRSRNI